MKNKLIYLTTNPHKVEEANDFLIKKYLLYLKLQITT